MLVLFSFRSSSVDSLVDSADLSEAIFGSYDGLISVIGVIVGLLSSSRHTILAGAIGLAVASAVSMGAGEYLGDEGRNYRRAGIMAAATLIGTLVPIIPFLLFAKTTAIVGAAILALILAGWISWVRSKSEPTLRSWIETYSILAISITITFAVTVVTGVGG